MDRTRLTASATHFFDTMRNDIKISDYDYALPEECIAKYPLDERTQSKLLIYKAGDISQTVFARIDSVLPAGTLLVFNNTKVIRARVIMHKQSGARIEIFCLEPHDPADYERAFSVKGECVWQCIIGNAKKWKGGALTIGFDHDGTRREVSATRVADDEKQLVRFAWDADLTFGQLLEHLGRIPIPPYLNRESQEIDNTRYQTVYSKFDGSVAAPTAGLHFSNDLIERMRGEGFGFGTVTLHVGAGTFLPVKSENVTDHTMHSEHFEITADLLRSLLDKKGKVFAVGTTSVRTLESLTALAWRIRQNGDPDAELSVGQWELYNIPEEMDIERTVSTILDYMAAQGQTKLKASTQIMIMPGYVFRVVDGIITNFHQPKSTLLLLVSAFIGDDWHRVYDHALANGFRFLSYGDSSVLMR